MKKLLLLSIFILSTASVSFAQTGQVRLSPEAEKKCSELTRAMSETLQLNELEYIKVKALNREFFAKTAEILAAYKSDKAAREQMLQDLEGKFEDNLKALLTPMQLHAYTHYKSTQQASMVAVTEAY
ncbi:hypothetical protein ACMA1I_04075 [Pontibacter sp. 13R65]|uniref:hypothetical protein n=1 Tax=Pontibacter sp. 13R65 TaxID=3127458 RepID=UPI00301DC5C2